jgi:CheY-like chemotaxis protein
VTLILAVDDKHENLYYLRVLLSAKGFTVVSARHGAEALALARANPPDLVISDLLMPVMDGYTLLRHWKADARLKKAPFIVYTATYTEEADEQLAYSLGADAFILKPAEPDDFLARLAEVQARAASAAPLPPREPTGDETARLKVYSETLIRKLEEKTLQLEEANRALKEDISRREAADLEIKRANRALTMLGACNEALIRATEEDSLLQDICRIVVDVGGYRVSAVGLANDDKEKSITIRAHTGDVPPSFLQLPRSWATGGEGSQAPRGAGDSFRRGAGHRGCQPGASSPFDRSRHQERGDRERCLPPSQGDRRRVRRAHAVLGAGFADQHRRVEAPPGALQQPLLRHWQPAFAEGTREG